MMSAPAQLTFSQTMGGKAAYTVSSSRLLQLQTDVKLTTGRSSQNASNKWGGGGGCISRLSTRAHIELNQHHICFSDTCRNLHIYITLH